MPLPMWLEHGWCANMHPFCEEVWWCGPKQWLASTAKGAAFWLALFYFIAFAIFPLVERRLKSIPSKFNNESTRYWFAWHVVSVCHSSAVSYLSAGPVYRLSGQSRDAQLGSPHTLLEGEAGLRVFENQAACGNVSQIFLYFVCYDVVVISLHGLAKMDMLAHHFLFVCFVILVSYNCCLGYLAGWMMLMEVSTIFLNYFSFFRNRLGYEHWTVKVSFAIFAATYVFFRVICMGNVVWFYTWSMFDGSVNWKLSGVGGVPAWQLGIIFVGVVAAWALQLSWFLQGIRPKLEKILLKWLA